jgi:uncharacterized protein YbjT (DUF2867 family)
MKLTANIIGATGLVGTQLVQLLLKNNSFEKVRIFVRHDSGLNHPKLEQHIVGFSDEKAWSKYLKGDILFSALGTTLTQAGNKDAQYEVDYTFNLGFAKKAKENGIENYILISSLEANANSKIFYLSMKGKLDAAITKLKFKKLTILRPASFIGKRKTKRLLEFILTSIIRLFTKIIFKKYNPIKNTAVAQAMVNAAISPNSDKTIWEGAEVFKLAGEI